MTTTSDLATAPTAEAIVTRWIEAFNARDLDGMLTCAATRVELRPLRLNGVERVYRGHDGVRRWFAQLDTGVGQHRVSVAHTRRLAGNALCVAGVVDMPGVPAVSPFWGLYRLDAAGIVVARHYLSDVDITKDLGWLA